MCAKPYIRIEKARTRCILQWIQRRETLLQRPQHLSAFKDLRCQGTPLCLAQCQTEKGREARIPGVILRITERQRFQEIRPIALHPIYIRERFFPEEIHIGRKREPRFEREK